MSGIHRPEDHEFVNEMKNRIIQLRHFLHKADASRSGCLNGAEFKSSLIKVGYSRDNDNLVKHLFDSNASTAPDGSTIGTYSHFRGSRDYESRGKTLDIEKFLKRVETTTTNTDNFQGQATALEDRRILRKALHATRQQPNSYKYLKGLCESPGRISVNRLKDGLSILGANISSSQMDVVIEKVGTKSDGNISLSELDDKLKESIEFNDKVETILKVDRLRKNPHYSNSTRSQDDLVTPVRMNFNEFDDGIKQSNVYKRDQLLWSKLQRRLQSQGDAVVSSLSIQRGSELPLSKLTSRLSDVGVHIGSDDTALLKAKIKQSVEISGGHDELVSLDQFCEVAGIHLSWDSQGRPVNVDVHTTLDEGVFSSSRRSYLSTPTFSTSMYNRDKERVSMTRRRSERPVYEHTYSPSKFWELAHSGPVTLMSAIPDRSLARERSMSPTRRPKWGQKAAVRGKVRASSAPPLRVSDLLVESAVLRAGSGSGATTVETSRAPVSRWASRSLADFISSSQSTGGVSMIGANTINVNFPSDPIRRKVSLKRQGIPAGKSAFTVSDPPYATGFSVKYEI